MGAAGWLVVSLALLGCGDSDLIDDRFTVAEWTVIQSFTPLDSPAPNPTNRYADNLDVARFGQKIFFEKRHSGALTVASDLGAVGETGRVACASCHDPTAYFTDTRATNQTSTGAAITRRNAPSLVNVVYYTWGNWAGAHDQFWKQGANSPETRDNLASNRLAFAHLLFEKYRTDYDALFPIPLDAALDPAAGDAARFPPNGKPKAMATDPDGPWETMAVADQQIINTIMANWGKAFEAYERRLTSANAPFDRYVAGDFTALSVAAKRGLQIFIGKAACVGCHSGTTFTDNAFYNSGVMQTRDPLDQGRFDDLPRALMNTFSGAGAFSDDPVAGMAKLEGQVLTDDLKGKFRTKSLRHVSMTAPYFHDGSMATLEDVVRFYNAGGNAVGFPGIKDPRMVPLNLSEQEILDVVSFLESLTGEPVSQELTVDTSNP
jgi:cytochrome c peroxidase